jgi:hypothetical protein
VADSSALDAAVINKLLGDSQLMTLLPDGVYFDQATPGAQRYTLVTITSAPDTVMFNGRAFEGPIYLVLAVVLSVTGGNVQAAAARIDALLDGATVSATGYRPAVLYRLSRVRHSDPDTQDASHRWQTRGGEYGLLAAALN